MLASSESVILSLKKCTQFQDLVKHLCYPAETLLLVPATSIVDVVGCVCQISRDDGISLQFATFAKQSLQMPCHDAPH